MMNILFGIYYAKGGENVVGFMCNKLKKEIEDAGLNIDCFDVARTKVQIDELLTSGKYQVLICADQLGEDRIGGGTIRGWQQRHPDVTIILSVANERKGGEKLNKLCTNVPYYYNALYADDLNGVNIVSLLTEPRTREQAIIYYGVTGETTDYKEIETTTTVPTVDVNEVVNHNNNDNIAHTNIDIGEEADVKEELDFLTEDMTDDFFDKDLSYQKELVDEYINNGGEEITDPKSYSDENVVDDDKSNVDAEDIDFDFSDMFSEEENNEAFLINKEDNNSDSLLESPEVLLQAAVNTINEERADINDGRDIMAAVEENTNEIYDMVCNDWKKNTSRFPESGRVLKVFDNNTLLLEMEKCPDLSDGKTMEDFIILFVVKGTKGSFVEGKYKVGVKSFDGYPGRMLGGRASIIEVPGYDLVANQIEGCECGLIFLEQ